jgi:hypothetical protein
VILSFQPAGGASASLRPRLTAALLIGGLLLCGCASKPKNDFRKSDFSPNRAQYTLPLDAYQVLPGEMSYASELLVKQCTQRRGVTGYRVSDPPTPYLLLNPYFHKLFDLTIARRWGYSGPDLTQVVRSPDSVAAMPTRDANIVFECVKTANGILKTDNRQQNNVEQLIGVADGRARNRQSVRRALAAWKACLRPLGFADLPDDPDLMPTDAERLAWHFPVLKQDTLYYKRRRASVAEIQGATKDAQCRESSGYAEGFYQAQVDEQFKQMNQYPEIVAAARAYADQVNANVRAVIQQLSG